MPFTVMAYVVMVSQQIDAPRRITATQYGTCILDTLLGSADSHKVVAGTKQWLAWRIEDNTRQC